MDNNIFYELVTKELSGEATAKEKKKLEQYLNDPYYQSIYIKVCTEWEKEIHTTSNEFNLEKGLYRLRQKIAEDQTKKKQGTHHQLFKIAASILFLIGIGILGYKLTSPRLQTPKYVTIVSNSGERQEVLLPDSTTVYLNSNATLKYAENFTKATRDVFLTGEGFFKVKRNEHKPFIVHSGSFKTTVLGTKFNVLLTNDNEVQVTVKSGKVRVENPYKKAQVVLTKNNQASFTQAALEFSKKQVDATRITDWHRNILHLDRIPLMEAFEKIEKWYGVKVIYSKELTINPTIRATYTNEPLDKVLNSLQFMTDFNYEIKNDSILIK